MPSIDPLKQREFAVDVVRRLREANFEAYWAGGCVRDQLLNRTPYDYDVATSAHPEEIRAVFRHRKTLAVGAAFGVMTVVGPRRAGQVEVTTFRQDVSYSDGRHPDKIAFSSPEEDAQRRDFTINGMFFDPLDNRVVDFVGGPTDIERRILRAIGDARQRFTEDKLRMLRAIRFASILDFGLEEKTLAAIGEMADQISVVSAERIAGEVQIMLVHPSRVQAVRRLHETGLLKAILPEAAEIADDRESAAWQKTLALLGAIDESTFPLSMAAIFFMTAIVDLPEVVGQRWKLSRDEIDRFAWLLEHRRSLVDASRRPWSQVQPLMVHPGIDELIRLHAAEAAVGMPIDLADVEFAIEQRRRPSEELNPPPLIDGQDLIALGIPRGPVFALLLNAAREAQLDGKIKSQAEALTLVSQRWQEERRPQN